MTGFHNNLAKEQCMPAAELLQRVREQLVACFLEVSQQQASFDTLGQCLSLHEARHAHYSLFPWIAPSTRTGLTEFVLLLVLPKQHPLRDVPS